MTIWFLKEQQILRIMAKESLVLFIYYDQVVQKFQIDGIGVASLQVITLKPYASINKGLVRTCQEYD